MIPKKDAKSTFWEPTFGRRFLSIVAVAETAYFVTTTSPSPFLPIAWLSPETCRPGRTEEGVNLSKSNQSGAPRRGGRGEDWRRGFGKWDEMKNIEYLCSWLIEIPLSPSNWLSNGSIVLIPFKNWVTVPQVLFRYPSSQCNGAIFPVIRYVGRLYCCSVMFMYNLFLGKITDCASLSSACTE